MPMVKDLDLERELAQHLDNAQYTRDARTTRMSLRAHGKIKGNEEKAYITLPKM